MLLGVGLFVAGIGYDVIFAGIPFQDPTPEMTASYNRQAAIASAIRNIGLVLIASGGIWFVASKLTK